MKKLKVFIFMAFFLGLVSNVFAHCEIPCGIYDDQLRVKLIHEHIGTVEKSMKKIVELTKDEAKNYNQIVRWVNNKEKHAEEIQDIVNQYFLTQRIKIKSSEDKIYGKYIKELSLLHEILVYAMKAKQTLDVEYVKKLHTALELFSQSYFGEVKQSKEVKGSK